MSLKIAEINRAKGAAFLAENKKQEGVVETPSGLQYKIIAPGDDVKPAPEDMVTVHYRGTTIDGGEFDSSHARGAPATFALQSVIKGWTEGLQLIGQGGRVMLYIPADLAYGDRTPTTKIRPGATLVFDVELIAVDRE
jgi:FKBP-type peptidyl-prolyl cis-trans isomerase